MANRTDKLPSFQERQKFDEFTPFWDAYNVEAESYDKELIKEWASDLDALLIFAGLFASTNTAFIIESYKRLQEDPTETNNLILRNILHRLDNSTFNAEELKFTNFQVSKNEVRVNCLFFASLSFSLFAAFGAVLAKQWLSQYEGGDSRVRLPSDRARKRHKKYQGLQKWYLRPVVETLPTLLQISLFLFLVGLVDFLWRIHRTVAHVVLVISVILFIFYSSTTTISVFTPNAPFQTRFTASLRGVLEQIRRSYQSSSDTKRFEDDQLREECVAWVLNTATHPRTIRTVCEAISMLPSSGMDNHEGLHDWNIISRYLRTIISNGVVLTDVPSHTLPSALEILFRLIQNSVTPRTPRDSYLVSKELIPVLPGQLLNEPASSTWILRILGTIHFNNQDTFRIVIDELHDAIGRSGVRSQGTGSGGIIDQFLLMLGTAVDMQELDRAFKISNMLKKVVESNPQGFELSQEQNIRLFLTLLEHSAFSKTITPTDRTSLLYLSSALIQGVILHRVEKLTISHQNPSITMAKAGADLQLRDTLNLLHQLLKNHGLKNESWEVHLLYLFRSWPLDDVETSAIIIQVLGFLAPGLSSTDFHEGDRVAFRNFLAHSPNADGISASILVLFCACDRNAAEALNLLTTSSISEAELGNFFLAVDSSSEMEYHSTARIEMGSKWLLRQQEASHMLFRANGWSLSLHRYGNYGLKDVYLKALKDLLYCPPYLWYSELVKDGHLGTLARIISAENDENSCDWMGCFLLMALWRWHRMEATKLGDGGDILPFIDAEIVQAIVRFFTSSRERVTRWNIENFRSHLDNISTLREAVLSANTYLQAAASKGLIAKDSTPALDNGYRRWVMSISHYLEELGLHDLLIWKWAHDLDGDLFHIGQALTQHENDPLDSSDVLHDLLRTVAPSTLSTYLIRCAFSGSLLQCSLDLDDTVAGRPVLNYSDTGALNQKWILLPASTGAFLLQNVATGDYLTYQRSLPQTPQRLKDGTTFVRTIGVAPVNGNKACCLNIPSEWELRSVEDSDQVRLVLRDFPTMDLHLSDEAIDGSPFTLWEPLGGPREYFILERVEV